MKTILLAFVILASAIAVEAQCVGVAGGCQRIDRCVKYTWREKQTAQVCDLCDAESDTFTEYYCASPTRVCMKKTTPCDAALFPGGCMAVPKCEQLQRCVKYTVRDKMTATACDGCFDDTYTIWSCEAGNKLCKRKTSPCSNVYIECDEKTDCPGRCECSGNLCRTDVRSGFPRLCYPDPIPGTSAVKGCVDSDAGPVTPANPVPFIGVKGFAQDSTQRLNDVCLDESGHEVTEGLWVRERRCENNRVVSNDYYCPDYNYTGCKDPKGMSACYKETRPVCGNGVAEEGEWCDPPDASDWCAFFGLQCNPATCSCVKPETCGNSAWDWGEDCDPTAPPPYDKCVDGSDCNNDCTCAKPKCGNKRQEGNIFLNKDAEECDLPDDEFCDFISLMSGDTYTCDGASCKCVGGRRKLGCGDGAVSSAEQCDPGNPAKGIPAVGCADGRKCEQCKCTGFIETPDIDLIKRIKEGKALPSGLSWLFGNEKININIEWQGKQYVTGVKTEKGSIIEVADAALEEPTMTMRVSENALKALADSTDVASEFNKQLKAGEIEYKAHGVFKKLKFWFVRQFLRIGAVKMQQVPAGQEGVTVEIVTTPPKPGEIPTKPTVPQPPTVPEPTPPSQPRELEPDCLGITGAMVQAACGSDEMIQTVERTYDGYKCLYYPIDPYGGSGAMDGTRTLGVALEVAYWTGSDMGSVRDDVEEQNPGMVRIRGDTFYVIKPVDLGEGRMGEMFSIWAPIADGIAAMHGSVVDYEFYELPVSKECSFDEIFPLMTVATGTEQQFTPQASQRIVIQDVQGDADVFINGQWTKAEKGQELHPGDKVVTGKDGKVAVAFDTEVCLLEAGALGKVVEKDGKAQIDGEPKPAQVSIKQQQIFATDPQVSTPRLTCSVRG